MSGLDGISPQLVTVIVFVILENGAENQKFRLKADALQWMSTFGLSDVIVRSRDVRSTPVLTIHTLGIIAKHLVSLNPHGFPFQVEFDIGIDAHLAAFRQAAAQLRLSSDMRFESSQLPLDYMVL